MANFEGIDDRITSAYQALDLFNMWRNVYRQSADLRRRLDLYLAGDDPVMARAIASVVTKEEIQELGLMRRAVDTLLDDWEANHRAALGLPPLEPESDPPEVSDAETEDTPTEKTPE